MPRLTEAVFREKIKLATLMDDPFMREFFTDNIPGVQLMLRIIMAKPDLVVESVNVQYVLRAGEGSRYVRVDVYAVDSDNRHYDIEIQNASSGASPQRARHNSAMMDVNLLKTGENPIVLKERESVVIFITEKDVLGEGEPIYIIDRVIEKSGRKFNDGSHIVYVNASHQDLSTELGKLMHDFHCVKPEDMIFPEIAEKAAEVKGSEKMGVWAEMEQEAIAEGIAEGMAKGIAKGMAQGITKASENIAHNLIKAGKETLEDIANICGLTLQRVQELARQNA
ncbi:MAG: hypothetical protein IJP89_09550 [Synergistaceae bacterium]|nr:hypothetical protein [Synergistaceae bacterium]